MDTWRETWLAMADYDPVKYEAIQRMEIKEYYTYYHAWKKRMEKRLENLKK